MRYNVECNLLNSNKPILPKCIERNEKEEENRKTLTSVNADEMMTVSQSKPAAVDVPIVFFFYKWKRKKENMILLESGRKKNYFYFQNKQTKQQNDKRKK